MDGDGDADLIVHSAAVPGYVYYEQVDRESVPVSIWTSTFAALGLLRAGWRRLRGVR